jgi:serine O-acetyltransferase
VVLCYSGFHALLLHRLSHWTWRRRWRLAGRFVSQLAKVVTGIEIHPGAEIGRRFVIDHGSGVVIGETSIVGNDVTLYQGVTLGGIAPSVNAGEQVNQKRHPTLESGVILGSGAQILGPIKIGKGARVGANAVVTKDVPPGVTAVGIPARVVMPRDRDKAKKFVAYGTPADSGPDPVLRTIEGLRGQVVEMGERIESLERRLQAMQPEGGAETAAVADETARGASIPAALAERS